MSMTLRQLEGLRHAPNRTMQRLAMTAIGAMERCDALAREVRELEERIAAEQLAKEDRLLVVLHRDGFVEVFASDWRPVKIAQLPSLGRGREEEAEGYMLRRLPSPYQGLYREGKRITAGHCGGCMNWNSYRLLQYEMLALQALNANGDETPDAAKAEAQPATVSIDSQTTAAAT